MLIEYVPNKGTFVRVNRAVAVSGANHDLMLAFLAIGSASGVRDDQANVARISVRASQIAQTQIDEHRRVVKSHRQSWRSSVAAITPSR